jgi:hypothetical protein
MFIPRFSLLAILAAFFPFCLWADDSGAGGGGGGGGNADSTQATALTQADVDKAVQTALAARDADFAAKLKAATGAESLDALAEAKAKAAGETDRLLAERTAELAAERQRNADMRIRAALSDAAITGKAVDPATVVALLAAQGKVEGDAVTIGGKPVAEAVKALLTEKPFLMQAGQSGGGTPQAGGGTGEKNPWHPDTLNLTEQGRVQRADPQKAERMKAEAKAAKKS